MKNSCIRIAYVIFLCVFSFSCLTPVVGASSKVNLDISKGVKYYGEVKNGKPHGKGTMNWYNQKTYSGEWINGKRSGYGKYTIIDKSEAYLEESSGMWDNIRKIVYTGYWKNDQQNGEGLLVDDVDALHIGNQSTAFYKGIFKNNKFIKGTQLSTSSGRYSTYRYKDESIQIEASTSDDEFQEAFNFNGDWFNLDYGTSNILTVDFLQSVEIGGVPNIIFTETDTKGNKITTHYTYYFDNEYGAISIPEFVYKNDKLISEESEGLEEENMVHMDKLLKKVKKYSSYFNQINKIYLDYFK